MAIDDITGDTPSDQIRPSDVFRHRKFPWSDYLQRHLTSSSVIVSSLHPIMGLRVAALFVDLTNSGHASDTPGRGDIQILSGVRTRAHQTALYNEICLRQRRCSFVAHPTRVHGVDAEGVQRQGSNHMAQRQPWKQGGKRAEVGYAVDLRNNRGTDRAAWAPVHDILAKYGLDWPLKGSPLERWHIEWFPRSASGPYAGPWPQRPGVHRQLVKGAIGGDVRILQRQLGASADSVFGASTERKVNRQLDKLGLEQSGVWGGQAQRRWERAQLPPPPPPAPAPPAVPVPPAAPVIPVTVETLHQRVLRLEQFHSGAT